MERYKYISHKDTRVVHLAWHFQHGVWIACCKPREIRTDRKYKIYPEDRLGGKSMCKDCVAKAEKWENVENEV